MRLSKREARGIAGVAGMATTAAASGLDRLQERLDRSREKSEQRLDDARRERVQALLDAADGFERQAQVPEGKKERLGHRRAAKQAVEYRAKAAALLDEWGIEP